jgi:hypothetical protein
VTTSGTNRIQIDLSRHRVNRDPARKSGGCRVVMGVQSCELRDDSKVGADWDVMLIENGEPRRCARGSG